MHLPEDDRLPRKPGELCAPPAIVETKEAFYLRKRQELDDFFRQKQLRVRLAGEEDFSTLHAFIKAFYYGHQLVTPLFMHQILTEGDSLLLEDEYGDIKGYILEVSYLKNRTSHGVSMAIHPGLKGQSAGAQLFMYSAITAMKRGARLKKGMMTPTNYASVVNIINRCGAVATSCSDDLKGLGPKLLFTLPLEPQVLGAAPPDVKKAEALIRSGLLSLVPASDWQKIKKLFDDNRVIIGFYDRRFITLPKAHWG